MTLSSYVLQNYMRLLITGSRHGHRDVERWMLEWSRKHGKPEMLVVGDALGVDEQAWLVGRDQGWFMARVCVNDSIPSPRRFLDRNERMVAHMGGSGMCLAFPRVGGRGTWHTFNLAGMAGLVCHAATEY